MRSTGVHSIRVTSSDGSGRLHIPLQVVSERLSAYKPCKSRRSPFYPHSLHIPTGNVGPWPTQSLA